MGLIADGSVILTEYNKVTTPSQTTFVEALCEGYMNHALDGVSDSVVLSGSGKSAMKSKIMTMVSSSSENQLIFAEALSSYWGAESTPTPPHISVSNDASGKIQQFKAAVLLSCTSVSSLTVAGVLSTFSDIDSGDYVSGDIVYISDTNKMWVISGGVLGSYTTVEHVPFQDFLVETDKVVNTIKYTAVKPNGGGVTVSSVS